MSYRFELKVLDGMCAFLTTKTIDTTQHRRGAEDVVVRAQVKSTNWYIADARMR